MDPLEQMIDHLSNLRTARDMDRAEMEKEAKEQATKLLTSEIIAVYVMGCIRRGATPLISECDAAITNAMIVFNHYDPDSPKAEEKSA